MGDECSPPCEQALCHWESNRGTYPDRPGSRSGEPPSRPSEASASRMAVALRCSSNPFVVQGRYPDAWYGAIIEPSSTNSVGRENWPPRLFFECGARGCPHLRGLFSIFVVRRAMQFDGALSPVRRFRTRRDRVSGSAAGIGIAHAAMDDGFGEFKVISRDPQRSAWIGSSHGRGGQPFASLGGPS